MHELQSTKRQKSEKQTIWEEQSVPLRILNFKREEPFSILFCFVLLSSSPTFFLETTWKKTYLNQMNELSESLTERINKKIENLKTNYLRRTNVPLRNLSFKREPFSIIFRFVLFFFASFLIFNLKGFSLVFYQG